MDARPRTKKFGGNLMNELQRIFEFKGQELRIVTQNGEPWFVASDVCRILEIQNVTQAIQRLEENERSMFNIGRQGNANIVNESGLYELIFASRKLEAKMFKKWVKQEVLPSIRKHGAYLTPNALRQAIADPSFTIGLLQALDTERQEKQQLQTQILVDKPFTNFGKIVSNSTGAISVGAFAKMMFDNHGIKMGRNKMFEWLRDNGYLIKQGREFNNPKQTYIEQGLFEVKPTIVSRTEGDVEKLTTLVSGKGQIKLAEILLKEFHVAM